MTSKPTSMRQTHALNLASTNRGVLSSSPSCASDKYRSLLVFWVHSATSCPTLTGYLFLPRLPFFSPRASPLTMMVKQLAVSFRLPKGLVLKWGCLQITQQAVRPHLHANTKTLPSTEEQCQPWLAASLYLQAMSQSYA